jgi:hypothetical protein
MRYFWKAALFSASVLPESAALVVVVARLLVHVLVGDLLEFGDGEAFEVVAGFGGHGWAGEEWVVVVVGFGSLV